MKKKQILLGIVFMVGLSTLGDIFHTCYAEASETISKNEAILSKVEKQKGFRPNPLLIMSKRNDVLSYFMSYGNQIFERGPLTAKEVYLIALSAAVALKSPICIRAHSKSAEKLGASKEEIIQTILVAGLISNTAPLHIAYDSAEMIKSK
jgi:AhpD family alkylhydroperoxidase